MVFFHVIFTTKMHTIIKICMREIRKFSFLSVAGINQAKFVQSKLTVPNGPNPTLPLFSHGNLTSTLNNFGPTVVSKSTKSIPIQYISDLNVHFQNNLPKIETGAKILAICGNIGIPHNENFKKFFSNMSKQFETVLFVAGTTEYIHNSLIDKTYSNLKTTNFYIQQILSDFSNVYFLNNSIYILDNGVIIYGSTYWPTIAIDNSNCLLNISQNKHDIYIKKHEGDKISLLNIKKLYQNNSVVVLTNHSPFYSRRLGFTNYREVKFTHNASILTNPPFSNWIYGNTNQCHLTYVNNVRCLSNGTISTKIISV